MTISIASTFSTTDGKSFPSRKEAEAHQAKLVRIEKLTALFPEGATDLDELATQADAVIAALSNPLGKGRKPKDTPAA